MLDWQALEDRLENIKQVEEDVDSDQSPDLPANVLVVATSSRVALLTILRCTFSLATRSRNSPKATFKKRQQMM